ncbi:MAG: phosphoribosylamine--glycine ligase [Thermotogota bacterium]
MRVLVIGSGGREHAICWKLSQSPKVEKVICLPGNPGIAFEDKCECIEEGIDYKTANGRKRVLEIVKFHHIDFTIVGPEEPLVHGVVDDFRQEGLKIIGPEKRAALLEGSKDYAKAFMSQYGVRTPYSETVDDYEDARKTVDGLSVFPIVIKADGLAAGKGVYICSTKAEALNALEEVMKNEKFGASGKRVLIEEFIDGEEISVLALTDSKVIKPLLSSKDHKRLLDNDKGPNTGGMGVVTPNPVMTEAVYQDFIHACLNPTIKGLKESGVDYRGIIFFGLMVKDKKCYVLEYNVRMGDPETQSILPLMSSDFMELLIQTEKAQLEQTDICWHDGVCVNVVLASMGYPEVYEKGKRITGYDASYFNSDVKVFFAGVGKGIEGKLINQGGRVLSVSAIGHSIFDARKKAYEVMKHVTFDGSYYRKDIGSSGK